MCSPAAPPIALVRHPSQCHSHNVGWLKSALGAAIIVFTIREMFNDLFHPTQSGAFSGWIASGLFRLYKRLPSMLPTSGPLSVALVIAIWAFLLATGFALIYWATFPE